MIAGSPDLHHTFRINFSRTGISAYRLTTCQILPVSVGKAFSFFEDPENLAEITPDWLQFEICDAGKTGDMFQGKDLAFTIRWLGLRFGWHTKIVEYSPPERFTDLQVRGPYRLWRHLHTFKVIPEGTLMKDDVSYSIPYGYLGEFLHRLCIMRQLRDIFTYRSVRISEWAAGRFRSKGQAGR